MLKREGRKLFREKRAALSDLQRMKWDDLLLIQFQQLQLPALTYVLSFYPMEQHKEINTFIITDFLRFRNPGLQVCYPKIKSADSSMSAMVAQDDYDFEANTHGTLEPIGDEVIATDMIDLVLVPMLAFDEQGNRIGFGKGFYDRYLAQCREDCLKVGLSYFDAIDRIDDASVFDVPLDLCITPQRVYVF